MIVGILGNTVFETSPDYVKTLTDMSRTRTARIAKHDIIGNKPKLEYQGVDLVSFSFKIRLDANLGVDPEQELKALEDMQEGFAPGLTIGNRYFGKFLIESIGEDIRFTRKDGATILAELDISLLEYIDD